MARLLRAALLLCVGLGAASCGPMRADHIPVWAGGEPAGVPPRPGSPGYEEYRQKLGRSQPPDADKTPSRQTPPPSSNGDQKN